MQTSAIHPPRNPFWQVFRTFGRDELTGGVIALVATAFIEGGFYLYNNGWNAVEIVGFTAVQMLALALAGPILEKVGFFFWHIKEARDTFKSTPALYRKPLGFYIRQALKGGSKTLMWDILLHDPLYVVLMLVGMKVHPATPAWLLVPVAFGLAVVAVALLEVGINEIKYYRFTKKLQKTRHHPFKLERYYDARFYLDPSVDPEEAINTLRNRFLPDQEIRTRHYDDYYFAAELPEYNSREGALRVRCRDLHEDNDGHDVMLTVQYIYSRIIEGGKQLAGQFRCFPRQKEKHYQIRGHLQDALDAAGIATGILGSPTAAPYQKISFERRMVSKPDALLLAVDKINDDLRVIEVKVYPEKLELLIEAMHFVMHTFPAMQTTHPKMALMEGFPDSA